MAILTQGTQLYVLVPTEADPTVNEVLNVECITTFNPGGNPADQIETTCMEASTREYLPGLRTPGQATVGINPDPSNPSHIRLYELSQLDQPPVLNWALGFSDGKNIAPTLNTEGDDFKLPDGRTWFLFKGYIADFPFSMEVNSVVTTDISIQRSGPAHWIPKVITPPSGG